jgi:hypothetical protein
MRTQTPVRLTSLLAGAVILLVAGLSFAPSAVASVLLLDFGPTTTAVPTRSPYHAETGSTLTTWNRITSEPVGDVTSGLLYADGTAATGIQVDLGASSLSNTISFATQPARSNALGTTVNTGVFGESSVGKDGIWNGGSGGDNHRLGLQIAGLTPGSYDVWVVALNTNIGSTDTSRGMKIGAMATAPLATLDTTNLPVTSTLITTTDAWVADDNYAKFTVEVTAQNPNITLFSYNDATGNLRGFFNAVMVAPVPEPTTLAMLAMAAATGLCLVCRRRR